MMMVMQYQLVLMQCDDVGGHDWHDMQQIMMEIQLQYYRKPLQVRYLEVAEEKYAEEKMSVKVRHFDSMRVSVMIEENEVLIH